MKPTGRSTGPYTACRHLGLHFMLAQTPSCCSGPVSFDVRLHKTYLWHSRFHDQKHCP